MTDIAALARGPPTPRAGRRVQHRGRSAVTPFSTWCFATTPDQCTLVPVRPGEITSQAGWPPDDRSAFLAASCDVCRRRACGSACSSIPILPRFAGRPNRAPIASSSTPSRSPRAFARGHAADQSFAKYVAAAELAHSLGLGVNAGHDLDLENLRLFRTLPHLDEVSIGHALISRALWVGLDQASCGTISTCLRVGTTGATGATGTR